VSRPTGWPGRVGALSVGYVTRIPAQDPAKLVLGESAAELALRALLGALEERAPEFPVQLPAPSALDRLAQPVVHPPILAFRSARCRPVFHEPAVLTAVARLEASHP
jgi:hypothetical protein